MRIIFSYFYLFSLIFLNFFYFFCRKNYFNIYTCFLNKLIYDFRSSSTVSNPSISPTSSLNSLARQQKHINAQNKMPQTTSLPLNSININGTPTPIVGYIVPASSVLDITQNYFNQHEQQKNGCDELPSTSLGLSSTNEALFSYHQQNQFSNENKSDMYDKNYSHTHYDSSTLRSSKAQLKQFFNFNF